MLGTSLALNLIIVVDIVISVFLFFQAEDGIRDLVRSRGLGDVYKRQAWPCWARTAMPAGSR